MVIRRTGRGLVRVAVRPVSSLLPPCIPGHSYLLAAVAASAAANVSPADGNDVRRLFPSLYPRASSPRVVALKRAAPAIVCVDGTGCGWVGSVQRMLASQARIRKNGGASLAYRGARRRGENRAFGGRHNLERCLAALPPACICSLPLRF